MYTSAGGQTWPWFSVLMGVAAQLATLYGQKPPLNNCAPLFRSYTCSSKLNVHHTDHCHVIATASLLLAQVNAANLRAICGAAPRLDCHSRRLGSLCMHVRHLAEPATSFTAVVLFGC